MKFRALLPLRHYEHVHLLSNIEKLPLPILGMLPFWNPTGDLVHQLEPTSASRLFVVPLIQRPLSGPWRSSLPPWAPYSPSGPGSRARGALTIRLTRTPRQAAQGIMMRGRHLKGPFKFTTRAQDRRRSNRDGPLKGHTAAWGASNLGGHCARHVSHGAPSRFSRAGAGQATSL